MRLDTVAGQHAVVDTAVVRGLAQAYMARSALELSDGAVGLIRDRIAKSANSTFYAYPALRLNQINWPIEIYALSLLPAVPGVPSRQRGLRRVRHDCLWGTAVLPAGP
jgi:hypothetical protein